MSDTKGVKTPPNPKHVAFISAYVDPESPTYGNATRSAEVAGYKGNNNVLGNVAHNLLKSPKVRESVETRLAQLGADVTVRLQLLRDIMTGTAEEVTTTHQEVAKGEWRETRTVRKVPASVRVKAIDIANKMTGLYDENRAKGDAASRAMIDEIKRERKRIEREATPRQAKAIDEAGAGDE